MDMTQLQSGKQRYPDTAKAATLTERLVKQKLRTTTLTTSKDLFNLILRGSGEAAGGSARGNCGLARPAPTHVARTLEEAAGAVNSTHILMSPFQSLLSCKIDVSDGSIRNVLKVGQLHTEAT